MKRMYIGLICFLLLFCIITIVIVQCNYKKPIELALIEIANIGVELPTDSHYDVSEFGYIKDTDDISFLVNTVLTEADYQELICQLNESSSYYVRFESLQDAYGRLFGDLEYFKERYNIIESRLKYIYWNMSPGKTKYTLYTVFIFMRENDKYSLTIHRY